MCAQMSVANFTLEARFKIPPSSGPAKVPLKIVVVEMVPSVTWGVLSVSIAALLETPSNHSLLGVLELLLGFPDIFFAKLGVQAQIIVESITVDGFECTRGRRNSNLPRVQPGIPRLPILLCRGGWSRLCQACWDAD